MNRTSFAAIAILLIMSLHVSAQTINDGKKAIELEQYGKAKQIFNSLTGGAEAAEAYFQLGQLYLKQGKEDSAKTCFDQGIAKDAKGFKNYIGLAQIALNKGDQAGADLKFADALKQTSKKDPWYWIAVAEAYINSSKPNGDKALEAVQTAQKNQGKLKIAYLYMVMGDAYNLKNDFGNAMTNYETSTTFDKTFCLGFMRSGMLYMKAKKPDEATVSFENILNVDANYIPVYRELTESYYDSRKLGKAVESAKKYYELTNSLDAKKRYAELLYLSKDYNTAFTVLSELTTQDPNNLIAFRLLGYVSYEKKSFDDGIKALDTYFAKYNKDRMIAQDFEYYGKLMLEKKQDSLAMVNFEKAVSMDSSKYETRWLLGETYFKRRMYLKAAEQYNLKITNSQKQTSQEYHKMGLAYFYGAQFMDSTATREQVLEKYVLADSAFSAVTRINASWPGGYVWRGNANYQKDTVSAKPFFEKAIELGEVDKDKNKKDLITSYKYMGFYYVLQKDNAQAKPYWEKVLELDPNDQQAKDVLKSLK